MTRPSPNRDTVLPGVTWNVNRNPKKAKCAVLLLGIGGVLISLPKAMSP